VLRIPTGQRQLPPNCSPTHPTPLAHRWMKGDEAVLVPAAAFMNKSDSERWLEERETAAVDHAAVDEWMGPVGVLRPDDQVRRTRFIPSSLI